MGREPPLDWRGRRAGTGASDREGAGATGDGDAEAVTPVAPQGLVEVLSSGRRRRTLHVLRRRGPPVPLDELAETVAELEADENPADPATVRGVSLTLHHVHLPKLDDAGLVDYDPDRNLVEGV